MASRRAAVDADVILGERAAQRVLAELGLSHAAEQPIEDIAWLRGAWVRQTGLRGCQGRLTRIGKRGIISLSEDAWYRPRQRFIIAHELGHLEIHAAKENQLALCTESDINEHYDQGTEREANAFATELLMPASLWQRLADVRVPSLDVVSALAERFEVSVTAGAIRFAKLCPERCAVAYSTEGRVQWCARASEFRYWIPKGHVLSKWTLAYDYFHGKDVERRPTLVEATAWLDAPWVQTGHELYEDSRPIPSQSAVLSLLWIPGSAGL